MALKKLRGTLLMLAECVRMSLSNIFSNRLRSFLTVLGILIGVTAVIALITTVSGFSAELTNSFTSLGAGSLMVSVTGSDTKKGLTVEELQSLSGLELTEGVAPNVSVRADVSRGGHNSTDVNINGRSEYYFTRDSSLLKRGRAINAFDERDRTYVCLITQEMAEEFFFGADPVGKMIYLGSVPFTVTGMLDEPTTVSIASIFNGSDDIVIPYTTALKLNSSASVRSFTAYIPTGADSDDAQKELEAKLDALFSYEDDCYSIMSMSSIEGTMQTMLSMVSALLAGIASIALVVGGIGIMNMMLTTVTERTTEIGLKKALGALPWQIQAQFLIESFLLSMIGGLLGIILGLSLSLLMCNIIGMAFSLSIEAIALGFGFSAAVGLVFGWAPARKASRLNPIDALRSM